MANAGIVGGVVSIIAAAVVVYTGQQGVAIMLAVVGGISLFSGIAASRKSA